MNGKGPGIDVAGVGVGLGGSVLSRQRTRNVAIRKLQPEVGGIRMQLHDVRGDVAGLRGRTARLEGTFDGHVRRSCGQSIRSLQ